MAAASGTRSASGLVPSRAVLVLALAADLTGSSRAAVASTPARPDDEMPSFEAYLERFNKSYGPDELERRRTLYAEALTEIAELNARPGGLWAAGVNRFTDATPEERARRRGPGAARARTSLAVGAVRNFTGTVGGNLTGGVGSNLTALSLDAAISMASLPKSVSWRHLTGKIRAEADCGGCWAVAAASTLDSHILKATGVHVDVSEQALVDCTYGSNGGNSCSKGGTRSDAFQYAAQHGIADAKSYPFLSAHNGGHQGTCKLGHGVEAIAGITGWKQVEANNALALMEALATVGPIAVGIDASKHWDFYKGGILDTCDDHHMVMDHDALLVGYGEENGVKYWLVQNGWGSDWGEAGFIRLKRHDRKVCAGDSTEKSQVDCGECGILSDPVYPTSAYLKQQHHHHSSHGHGHGGSCAAYGCVGYQPSHSCQCNAKCAHYGNCCSDYRGRCHSRRLADASVPVFV